MPAYPGGTAAVRAFRISPISSKRSATCSAEGNHEDAKSGAALAILSGHGDWVNRAAFSPDGSRIVTASFDNTARVWDAATGVALAKLSGHTDRVYSAAFSPDGSRIVTASFDQTVRIWDTTTGKELVALRGHEGDVWSAAFSPDGSRVATGSGDKTARVWDVRFVAMTTEDLIVEACARRLRGLSILSRDEMRLIGEPDTKPSIDVCAGTK